VGPLKGWPAKADNHDVHMVIFRRPEGKPGYHQAESVDDAIRFVEMLRNQEQVTDARIFRMEEVPIEVRTYYKVEVAGSDPQPAAGTAPAVQPSQAVQTPPVPPGGEPSNADAAELAPQEVLRPVPVAAGSGTGKGRRFNRG